MRMRRRLTARAPFAFVDTPYAQEACIAESRLQAVIHALEKRS